MTENGDNRGQKRVFPLDVVPMPGGWGIVVYLRNDREWTLMKPGWQEEQQCPYMFETSEEAWGFLKRLFMFCLHQHQAQYKEYDKIMNCEQCGRIFRARYYKYCFECLQQNEFLLQQLWQGFYYMTGSQEASLEKMSMLLRIPVEQCRQIPGAFNTLVNRNLQQHMEWDKLLALRNQTHADSQKSVSGMHHRRRD